MNSLYRYLMAVFTAALLIAAGPARADMGPVARGPGKSPGGTELRLAVNPSIRLDALEVILKLKKNHYVVYATLHFFNTGKTTKQSIIFPKPWEVVHVLSESDPRFERIDGWVNGRKLEHPEDSPWMLHDIAFRGHERSTIRIRHEAGYCDYPYHYASKGKRLASYPLGMFGIWKGALIGRGVFTVDGSEVGGKEYFSSALVIHTRSVDIEGHDVPYRAYESKDIVRYEIRDFWPFKWDRFEASFSR